MYIPDERAEKPFYGGLNILDLDLDLGQLTTGGCVWIQKIGLSIEGWQVV